MSSIHKRTAKHAVLPLAACAVAALGAISALPASAQALQAQRIVIDKDTGRARMPEGDELTAPTARAAARSSAATDPMPSMLANHPAVQRLNSAKSNVVGANGARGRRIELDQLSFTVVRRDASGRLASECVAGPEAARQALQGALKGDDHEH